MGTELQILKMNGSLNKKLSDQYLYEIINILLMSTEQFTELFAQSGFVPSMRVKNGSVTCNLKLSCAI